MNDVVDFINVNRDRYIDELKEYLAIPSISALPEHAADVRRAAQWTADAIGRAGMQNVRLIETPGNPVVYGDWLHAPGKPTILFYGHYDVQPVDPLNLWTTPPFDATVRDGEIYARGSADDKGQVFMHIKAVEAHITKGGRLPLNIKFFIEGEEEVGSVHLDDFIRAHRDELSADVVVISDSPMFDRGIPSICYGLRGLTYFQIDLRGTRSDLHSGSFGGAVANPAYVLANVLAQMKDKGNGHVRIPGFYDDVRPLSEAERAEWKKLPFNETRYRKALGAPRLWGEKGYSTLERVWARPTFEVNGLLSGFTGEGAKTVLPAVAMAKVSMRLVPDQDPKKIGDLFEAYVSKVAPKTVELTITRMHGGKPWMTEFDNKYVRAAGRAIEKGFGQAPVFNREGGSIPVVSTFQEELGLPSVLFGVGLPDENAHAPDEKLDLGNFHNGIIASAFLYEEIANLEIMIALVVAVLLSLAAAPAMGQALYGQDAAKDPGARSWALERAALPRFEPPRTSDGTPDLRGRWGGTPGGDDLEEHPYVDLSSPPEESFVSDPPDGKVPYQPWALAVRARIRAGLARGWPGETARLYTDPQTFCLYMVPRATYRGGFEIIQGPGYVLMAYGFGHYYRFIPTDGRPHGVARDVTLWMGNSRGSWDGNTLVVDVTNLNARDWLDQVGNFFSDHVHVVERFTLASANIIDYEATIDDPTVFTRPWTIRLPFRRARADATDPYTDETWENACYEGNRAGDHARALGFRWFSGVVPPQ